MNKRLIGILFILFFTQTVYANTNVINKQAEILITENQYKPAIKILKEVYNHKEYDNQTLFLLGIAYKASGNNKIAIRFFQELLTTEDTTRTRLELGESLLQYKKLEQSEEQFLMARKESTNDNVNKRIDYYLEQIAYLKKNGYPKNWRLSANVGYMYDSNANVGTNASQILLFNLPFTLSSDAKQTSDTALVSRFGFEHKKQFSKNLSLYSSVGLGNTRYETLSNFDLLSVNAQSGLVLEKGRFTYSLPFIANILKVGHTDNYYNYTYGVAPSIGTKLTQNILFDNQFIIQQREYKTYTSRTGHNLTYRPSFKYLFSNKHYLGVGGMFGRDSVQSEVYSNTAMGLNLEYFNQFTERFGFYVSPFFSNISYNAKENAFNEIRNDNLYSLYSMLSYKIKAYYNIEPTISLTHSYTQNNSNIDLYSYKRHQVSLNLGVRY